MSLKSKLDEISLLIRNGAFVDAIQKINCASETFGDHTFLRVNEATCYAELGNVKKAIEILSQVENRLEHADLIQRAKSKIYFKIGEYSSALQQLKLISPSLISSASRRMYVECYAVLGEFDNAAQHLKILIERQSSNTREDIWNLVLYRELSGQLDKAYADFKELSQLRNCTEIKFALAIITKKLGKVDLALRLLKYIEETEGQTDFRIGNEIATIFVSKGEIAEGIQKLEELASTHGNVTILGNLSRAYAKYGELEKSNLIYSRIPDSEKLYELVSNHLMQQLYKEKCRNQILSTHIHECSVFNKNEVRQVSKLVSNEKLKILFISSDFKRHSVAYFVGGLLNNKPHTVEVHCAYNGHVTDEITEFFKQKSDRFVHCIKLDDEALIKFIANENYDVIVEMNGHTAGNRLPALSKIGDVPIVSAIGYPATTGINTIRYRITDQNVDAVKDSDAYSERNLYIKSCYLNYFPIDEVPEVFKPDRDHFVFGSFNNYQKISEENLAVWSEILKKVHNSKLLLKSGGIKGKSIAKKIYQGFQVNGVDPDRIILRHAAKSHLDHMMQYRDVDLSLDTFPFGGATTTFESLYMNTPVLTMAMPVNQGRATHSVLRALKLDEEFSTTNPDDYILRAVYWANKKQKRQLGDISHGLRSRMIKRRLVNSKIYADNFFKLLEVAFNDFE